MPAPTALKKLEDAPPASVVASQPAEGKFFFAPKSPVQDQHSSQRDVVNGDDFLLDAQDDILGDESAFTPESENGDEAMAIDEEGRPRFAPSKDIVGPCPITLLS